jgi:hypothetical protein
LLGFDHEQYRIDRDSYAEFEEFKDGGSGDATPHDYLSVYDPDSIMNYPQYKRENSFETANSGALTNLDIQGVQAFSGPNPSNDDDRDGIPDRSDNFPYAHNRDQSDSNFEAELVLARQNGFPGDDGHAPTAADPVSYVTRWQATYRGDDCDPVALTPATIDYAPTAANGDTCNPGTTIYKSAANISVVGLRGDPIGTRFPSVNAVGAGAVCGCDLVGTADEVLACAASQTAKCFVARDIAFPNAPGSTPSGYTVMKQCGLAPSSDTLTSITTKLKAPVGVWGYQEVPTAAKLWDSKYDSTKLNVSPTNSKPLCGAKRSVRCSFLRFRLRFQPRRRQWGRSHLIYATTTKACRPNRRLRAPILSLHAHGASPDGTACAAGE